LLFGNAGQDFELDSNFSIRLTAKGGAHKLAEDNLAGSGNKLFEESVLDDSKSEGKAVKIGHGPATVIG
jgi:hypothetical protein